MNLLYWSPFYAPDIGGIETISSLALPLLVQKGYKILVIASSGNKSRPGIENINGVVVQRFPFRELFNNHNHQEILRLLPHTLSCIRNFDPDLVHVNLSDPSILLLHLCRLEKVPVITAIHNDFSGLLHKIMEADLFKKQIRRSNWITSVSHSGLQHCLKREPFPYSKTSVIHNAIPEANFINTDFTEGTNAVFLSFGRLVPQKNLTVALRGMRKVCDIYPNTRLIIIGDGHEKNRLLGLSSELQLDQNVTFIASQSRSEINPYISKCHMLLLPSLAEGQPLSLLESAAAGRAAIAFDVGDVGSVIEDKVSGLLIAAKDDNAFFDAMLYAVENLETMKHLGTKAQEKVRLEFRMNKYINAYDQLYQNLVNHREN